MFKSINTLKNLVAIILVLMAINTYSQQTIQINGAKGTGEIVGRISYEEARREALNQAKVEALRKAGVKENLQSYESLFRSEVNNDFSEFFSSDIQSELQGAIQTYEIVSQERKVDPVTSLFVVDVTINATVILYETKPDPTFNVRVEGIKGIYDDGENLTFSIFSTKDCYLHIFGIADSHTSILYPNSLEQLKLIKANTKIEFPLGTYEYPLFKSGKSPEVTRVVFVFTKEPISFLSYKPTIIEGFEEWITTSEEIFSWAYGLSPDIRKMDYHILTVR